MSDFDTLSHLTRPAVEKLPELNKQPPNINTRYAVKCTTTACLKAQNEELQTKIWFKTPPLTPQTIRMIRAVKLFAESHDQGRVHDLVQGNWTWFQLAILKSEKDTSPKKGKDGQELVATSHANKVASKKFEWLEGGTVDTRRIFLKALEPGNVIAVRLCARFPGWEIFATNGYLVIDIAEDNRPVPILPIGLDTTQPIPPRRNVHEWYKESKTNHQTGLEVSLFIRALNFFQQLPPEDQLSYYRIAGIHNEPFNVPWNMGKPVIALDNPDLHKLVQAGEGGSYCEHNNYLFPTWHRVYRRISDLAMDEATTRAAETDKWTTAARCWRMPYWDWAAEPTLPEIACNETIQVIKSWDGHGEPQMEELKNPMYRFQMPGLKPMGSKSYGNYRIENKTEAPWDLCIGTSRHGITLRDEERKWVDGVSNAELVNASLVGKHEYLHNLTLKDSVFRLLTDNYTTKYLRFSSTRWDEALKESGAEAAKEYLNLEQIHNMIHSLVGGTEDVTGMGHMMSVPVAAFDPVFWLHHCNVDRLLHLWQSSNPGNWFHQKRGVEVDASPQQALKPFHSSGDLGDFYNSNQVRNVDALNYSYDYVNQITDVWGDIIPEKSHLYINKLYGPTAEDAFTAPAKEFDPVINIIYDRYAFNGRAYFLHFFLGDLEPNVAFKHQKTLIGSIYTFSFAFEPEKVTCKDCYEQKRDNVLSRAQLPITTVVPNDRRLDRTMCREYLKSRLRWVAAYENGELADKTKLKRMEIQLSIGQNELRKDVGRKSLFRFDNYQNLDFDWNRAYAG
ncbi:hypothetical protein V2A60_002576 [Cordyceps javanica]|uniref:tyrosinase n=1 Tax=Cordyceps javanica TaxID=43265 RepID=A0A545VX13_9HYPO|nr:Di-copper centre-containing [Cordyceps javanica]TQW06263.1 Di-copper centre-containing [Cordyceps javanica]